MSFDNCIGAPGWTFAWTLNKQGQNASLRNHEFLNGLIPNIRISIYRKSHDIEKSKKDES